jgi:hypothetical protein
VIPLPHILALARSPGLLRDAGLHGYSTQADPRCSNDRDQRAPLTQR